MLSLAVLTNKATIMCHIQPFLAWLDRIENVHRLMRLKFALGFKRRLLHELLPVIIQSIALDLRVSPFIGRTSGYGRSEGTVVLVYRVRTIQQLGAHDRWCN